MLIEHFMTVISFTAAVVGLIALVLPKGEQKKILFIVIVTLIVSTTGLTVYQQLQHQAEIKAVQKEIIEVLDTHIYTFDQIYQQVHLKPFNLVNEALYDLVDNGKVGHRLMRFTGEENILLQARGYYVKS